MFTILFSNIFCKHHLMRIGKCLLSIGQLKEKSLICLHGGESMVTFLQGLISNDVKCISQPNSFMYSLFLNSKGRVLTDAFIYHTNRLSSTYQSNYLIEVDHVYTDDLVKHLSRYNLRGRVKIDTSLQLCPWIAMPTSSIQSNQLNNSQAWLPVNNNLLNFNDQQQVIFYASDPRGISGWSGRILSRSNTNVRDIFTSCNTQPLDIEVYHNARWRLGLPEGVHEFITNDTLPFEANTDLSGGVSFSKGCYIGQELTARTHFTGVIRRRYIPIRIVSMGNNADVLMKTMNAAKYLYNAPIYRIDHNSNIVSLKLKPVGWIRGINPLNIISTNKMNSNIHQYPITGIALIRLTEASEQLIITLPIDDDDDDDNNNKTLINLQIIPYIPSWWPEDIAPQIQRLEYT
ncbi:unnamed protein product [Heterobilharzia americana]|nr:unnamed protein product [Heterobilharzia americana]